MLVGRILIMFFVCPYFESGEFSFDFSWTTFYREPLETVSWRYPVNEEWGLKLARRRDFSLQQSYR